MGMSAVFFSFGLMMRRVEGRLSLTFSRKELMLAVVFVASCLLHIASSSAVEGVRRESSMPLHVGVVVFPELGHLNPMLSIVESLLAQSGGDEEQRRTTVFGPDHFMPMCQEQIGPLNRCKCASFGEFDVNQYDESFFQKLVERPAIETFGEVNKHVADYNNASARMLKLLLSSMPPSELPDVFLVDFGARGSVAVADYFGIPTVLLWPLTLAFPTVQNPSIPTLATAASAKMGHLQRLGNHIFQKIVFFSLWRDTVAESKLRGDFELAPVDLFEVYTRHPIIVPSIFGLDIAQSLCPNVLPVGFLSRLPQSQPQVLPSEWAEWVSECREVVYVNMGSVAVLPDSWLERIESGIKLLLEDDGVCVVWKVAKKQLAHVSKRLSSPRFRASSFLPFPPKILLELRREGRRVVAAFVTHCGDTSVYESLEAGVPLVGIPLFADQPDMCARVQDSGIGASLDKMTFTPESLRQSVLSVGHSGSVDFKLSQLHRTGRSMGGGAAAAEFVAMVAANSDLQRDWLCPHYDMPLHEFFDLDISVACAVLVVIGWTLLTGIRRIAVRGGRALVVG